MPRLAAPYPRLALAARVVLLALVPLAAGADAASSGSPPGVGAANTGSPEDAATAHGPATSGSQGTGPAQSDPAIDLLARLPASKRPADGASSAAPLAPGEALEIVARAPTGAGVHFAVKPAARGDSVELWWRTDTADWTRAAHTQQGELRRAELPDTALGPVELRFVNRSAERLQLARAQLVGQQALHAPLLPAALRPAKLPFNVLFYVIDTARRDRMSLYGYANPTTPRLDALAERSLVFERAYAPGPSTTPSISALFASRHPSDLGGRLSSRERVPVTFAETFQRAGYDTLALQANYMVRKDFGYGRGFDEYRVFADHSQGKRQTVHSEVLNEAAVEWLAARERKQAPFFLYVQSMDAHDYRPPEPFASEFRGKGFQGPWIDEAVRAGTPAGSPLRNALDNYDATVAYADHQIGALLDELARLGHADDTIVVVTSDHGEPLGQRGHLMHGRTLNEELVHIPLLVFVPWAAEARRVDGLTSLIDLPPTLADLAGLPISPEFAGHSLLQPFHRVPSVMGTRGGGRWRKQHELPHGWYLREDDWKLLLDKDGGRLYHLPSDPLEARDVADRHPVTARYLQAEIMLRSPAFREGWSQPALLEDGMTEAQRREFEAELRSLGYIE